MYNLTGKVALVTGAASKRGMGRTIALRLASEGADVIVSDVSGVGVHYSEDDKLEKWNGLKSVLAELKASGRKALTIEADITSEQDVEELVTKSITEFGQIDILVNNAGITGPQFTPAVEVSLADWNRVLSVNLTGTYLCSRAVAKRMIERNKGGKIINIISTAGKMARPGFVSYYASKFGVSGLTQVMAIELAKYKINVNGVVPAFVSTDISVGVSIRTDVRKGMSLEEATKKAYANMLPLIPLGRIGEPEDIANMVAFLASGESDYITGQAINVCGGFLTCH